MHVRVLGPLEVVRGNEIVTPSAPKLRRVLALLAVNAGSGVHTDQIVDELWEDRPPPSAMTTLQTYVYQLRKLLNLPAENSTPSTGADGADRAGVPTLRTLMGRYVLTLPSAALDSREFEQLAAQGRAHLDAGRHEEAVDTLRAALGLWRGPVFSDIGAGPVLQIIAVRLDEVRKSSLEQRIEAEMTLGRHHELISELTGLVAQQPTHEAFQAKLILALYRAGRRSDALQVYQRARAALTSELGLEPSSELQRLHRAVLHADTGLDSSSGPPAQVRVARAGPPPSDLPPDVSPFVGRKEALAQVRRLLQVPCQSAAPNVVVVYGKPGSGKSAFCVHAAHALRASYPDGQLFIELVDATGARVDTSTALGYCLRAARIPDDHVPVSLDERTRLFRSWTANRRMLMVLDDATSADQLLSLLPTGSGCAALVACRRRLPGPSIASTVCLKPLLACDAEAMLTEMLGRQRIAGDPAAAQELVQVCEGLHLALHTAATKLLLRPHWPIRRMIDRIRPDRHRPHMVSAKELGMHTSVRRTYQLMPPAVRATFRVAAALVQPTTAVAVRRALGVDVCYAEELLEELVEFELAEVERGGDKLGETFRYQVTPLVRASAAHLDGTKDTAAPGWHGKTGRASGALARTIC
ncbi:MAG: BTAD domain-containing putative transcriptional regulator [Pseudonocardiaceae bacterium]